MHWDIEKYPSGLQMSHVKDRPLCFLLKRLLSIIIITSVLSLYGCYPANRISLIQPDRRIDDVNAMNTRVVLLQSFSFNVGLIIYTLPFGEYYPEGQDYMGIYYRAPIPIKINELSGEKKFIQSGIYLQGNSLKTSSPFAAWIYFNDNESIRTELIHYKFIWSYGDTWYREAYYGNSK